MLRDSQSPIEAWQGLTVELRKQCNTIFQSAGEVILVEVGENSQLELMTISKTKLLKSTYAPERNAIKWETPKEYGFDRLSQRRPQRDSTLLCALECVGCK